MFLEVNSGNTPRKGWIEVICGSMFSGKTEELIRRLKRAEYANLKVAIFKPTVDTRYNQKNVVSHDENSIESTPLENSTQLLLISEDVQVVGIDEAQFFDMDLPNVCNELARRGIRVVIAGLDMDFLGKPFGPMPNLLACAEFVTKVHAVCISCGELANFSHRTSLEEGLVVLGETENYEPLCRSCYEKKNAAEKLKLEKQSSEEYQTSLSGNSEA
ncbi:MAG: thymidine kinase [Patiriisocius sp.]|jgi:thymidine kinase